MEWTEIEKKKFLNINLSILEVVFSFKKEMK